MIIFIFDNIINEDGWTRRLDKQMMLLAKSHVQLQLYGSYRNYNGNGNNMYIYLYVDCKARYENLYISFCHFNKLPPANKIYVLNVTKKVLKKPT